ncbi:type II secretion system protein N [Spongorhabdus nitratireducens]
MKLALASIGSQLSQKKNRTILIGCTVVLMCASIISQLYQVYRNTHNQPALSGELPTIQEEQTQPDVFNLNDFPLLFGFSDVTQEDEVEQREIPETRMNLVLRGAISGDGSQSSSAIIEEGGSTEQLYFIGEVLPGGATLAQVYSDHIVINRNGSLEKLYFPGYGASSLLTEVAPEPVPAAVAPSVSSPPADEPKNLEERMYDLREQLRQADEAWQP